MKCAVVGTGNIGKRHIQSLASLEDASLVYFDSFQESLESVEPFLRENNLVFSSTTACKNSEEFLSHIEEKTLVIVATTADGRVELTKKILEKKPLAILVEKPVCQTWEEYKELLEAAESTPIYVNFPRHMYTFYQELKAEIENKGKEVKVFQKGGGIACNGIHIFDLITWLFNIQEVSIESSDIAEPYETKRAGYFDIGGEVRYLLNKTLKFTLIDSQTRSCDGISIITDKEQIHIYEHLRTMIMADEEKLETKEFNLPYQSQLSSIIAAELFEKGTSAQLPSLQESVVAHKMLFDLLEKNKISMKFT